MLYVEPSANILSTGALVLPSISVSLSYFISPEAYPNGDKSLSNLSSDCMCDMRARARIVVDNYRNELTDSDVSFSPLFISALISLTEG